MGCGLISGRWIRALSADPRVDVGALVDVDPDAATRVARRCGLRDVPWFPDLEQALAATDAGIVVNLTPADHHEHHTRTALEHGRHVFTEKPLTLHLDGAQSLVALARSRGLVLAVMSNRGQNARFLAFRNIVHAAGPGPYSVGEEMFVRLPGAGFRARMTFPALGDLAVHAFDQIRQLVHAAPTTVLGSEVPLPFLGPACSVATVIVRFADDSVFAFRGGFGGPGHRTAADGHWRVDAACAGWRWDGGDTVTTFGDPAGNEPTSYGRLSAPQGTHDAHIGAMIDAVHGGPTLPDGLDAIALLDAALRSAHTGAPVTVTRRSQ
nr:Gfo/Idh/MocA family oxidoreductase [Streptomyces sp. SID3343]